MTEWRTFTSTAMGGPVRYRIIRGSGDAPLPVAYLLHGRGDSANSWEPVLEDLRRLPLIAVLPDAPWTSRASYYVDSAHRSGQAVETAFAVDLVADVDAHLGRSGDRRYRIVAGYSMGGFGALRLALAHSSVFSAAISLSPAVYVPEPPVGSSARESGAFGRGTDTFAADRYRELNYPALLTGLPADRAVRLAVAVGDAEPPHPGAPAALAMTEQARRLVAAADRAPGVQATLRSYRGGHDFAVWRPALFDALTDLVGEPHS
ncbi:MAG: alpha/beta fold hydrolase [Leifsonia sp.]